LGGEEVEQPYTTRHYCKVIAISEDNLNWIREEKGNKSAAGLLNEIIEFYKQTLTLRGLK